MSRNTGARRELSPLPQYLLAGLSLLVLGATLYIWLDHRYTERLVTHTVGVFVVLAELWRDGILYPPEPTTDLVYTTFYHPLAFGPIALLPGRGFDLLPSLRVLVGCEMLAGLAALTWLTRAFLRETTAAPRPNEDSSTGAGLSTWAQPAVFALCTVPVGFSLIGMRDDPRAALCALLAVAVYLRRSTTTDILCGLLLATGFFVKATAPFAPAIAIGISAWRQRGFSTAARIAIVAAASVALGIAWLQLGLGADFLGNGLRWAIFEPARPPRPWHEALSLLGRDLTWDFALPALLISSALLVVHAIARRQASLLESLVALVWLKTILAYRSTGTDLNHLLDIALFAALHVGVRANPWLGPRPWLRLALLLTLIAAGAPAAIRYTFGLNDPPAKSIHESERKQGADFLRQLPAVPTLCEEPLIAWQAGQNPLITDPFLTFAALRNPPHDAIRRVWFGPKHQPGALQRILLMRNPDSPAATDWYSRFHFDTDFLAEIRTNWRVARSSGAITLLQRR